jgi:cystathionine beta-lyase/cystathionine gamma-synthase
MPGTKRSVSNSTSATGGGNTPPDIVLRLSIGLEDEVELWAHSERLLEALARHEA